MTIGGTLDAMGTRDLRAHLRAVVEKVEAGSPVVCLKDGQPLAVMTSRGSRALAQDRRLARGASRPEASTRSPRRPLRARGPCLAETARTLATIRRLTSDPRAILSPLRTIGVSDARAAFATLGQRWPKVGCERSSPEVIWLSR